MGITINIAAFSRSLLYLLAKPSRSSSFYIIYCCIHFRVCISDYKSLRFNPVAYTDIIHTHISLFLIYKRSPIINPRLVSNILPSNQSPTRAHRSNEKNFKNHQLRTAFPSSLSIYKSALSRALVEVDESGI